LKRIAPIFAVRDLDADELAAAWRSAGVEVHAPEDTEWGQHEGAVVDPDGNVIRFGSPMRT
jgi:uncharacterized glyoxalase superfamily protein PhnB